jgi:hypothetical protein
MRLSNRRGGRHAALRRAAHLPGVYDAPTPEVIRRTAIRNQLPVDEITQVSVLDPYFYA